MLQSSSGHTPLASAIFAAVSPLLLRREHNTLRETYGRFAAVRMSAYGTKQTFRDVCYLSAFGGKADVPRASAGCRSNENDPKRT